MRVATDLHECLRGIGSEFLDDQGLGKSGRTKLAELISASRQLLVHIELLLGQLSRHLLLEDGHPVLLSLEVVNLTTFEQVLVFRIEPFQPLQDIGQVELVPGHQVLVPFQLGCGRHRGDTGIFDRTTTTYPVTTDVPEEGQQPVVILLADRVELVVVTTCTADGESQEDLGGRPQDVVEIFEPRLLPVHWLILPDAQAIISGRDDTGGGHFFQLVTGKLFTGKLVKRFVAVERPNYVVTKSPDIWFGVIAFVAVGFGIADQVQPVAGPLFAVVRRLQQPVDNLFESLRRLIGQERIHRVRGRRQAGQVIGCTTQQRHLFSRNRGRQTGTFQPGKNESINRAPDPRPVLDLRCGWTFHLLETPEGLRLCIDLRRLLV